ncbi:tetratricopeptide repeat protein [Sinimarinibacterium sp. CAU 1509]|uniref:tetratricopeptide repeat protein n=1 Tax=Sinimarinibacterium sp. CAU 1509 TaxID=2562283 RepID=UPI0010AB79DF|nr:tetratricopeptide repeat protein [Sinimarinibacterium sp. CAU 1509]TJY61154.1 tetratricopeptide repeat protein [Sinimarinibacterium sp. CAU 1509]
MNRRLELIVAVSLALGISACSGPGVRQGSTPRPQPPKQSPTLPAASADEADQRFKAALALMKDMQPDEARQAFEALAQAFPNMSGPLTNLGILYAQGHDREQAVANFSKAVAANPGNAVALNWLGILYRETGDFRRAEQAYLQALKTQPSQADAHLNLGILYEVSLRRPVDALTHYRAYLEHDHGDDLIVTAWVKELEMQVGTAVASSTGAGK